MSGLDVGQFMAEHGQQLVFGQFAVESRADHQERLVKPDGHGIKAQPRSHENFGNGADVEHTAGFGDGSVKLGKLQRGSPER